VLRAIEQTTVVTNSMGFRLGDISREARLTELEFHLPVARLNAASLAEVLGDAAANLDFAERKGWLKGFIDLVFEHNSRFYVVDWKSNRLGADGSAYTPEAIHAAMAEHHYHLQALLYVVALHRYLAARITDYHYDTHCGGALYYFVRGCDAHQPGAGVHTFRPDLATIEALNSWLHGEE
jgi:exodeoxyribonuclease V beta subunit